MKWTKKKILALILGILVLVGLNVLIVTHRGAGSDNYTLTMKVQGDQAAVIQLYTGGQMSFSEEQSQQTEYGQAGVTAEISFSVPAGTRYFRLDLGNVPGMFQISEAALVYGDVREELDLTDLTEQQNQVEVRAAGDRAVQVDTLGEDPYIVFAADTGRIDEALAARGRQVDLVLNGLMLLFLDGGLVVCFLLRKKIFSLPAELYHNRQLILSLAKNDFKTKYAGSYLGIVWAFVQPVVTILVYWFVFSVGLKAGQVMNYPFVLYLISGIVPWFFFQDALNGGTNALIEYNYLVKKVVFKISILPIVKIVSALFVHCFFVAFALIICSLYGYLPGLPTLQIFYYSGCTFLLALGLVYATSAVVVFFRDLTQIINIVLQVGVWMTPIMWDLSILSDHPLLMKLFKLNPMYYIVSGYRDAMLGHTWLTEHWAWTLYFWVVTVALFAVGAMIFKRLKVHFADVL